MTIIYKGYNISINESLLAEQNVWHNLKEICETRIKIQDLFQLAEIIMNHRTDCGGYYPKAILEDLTELEYELQTLWGFPKNKDFHTYQWSLPSCTCPSMDNIERASVGNPMRWIDQECPYHGFNK